LLQANAERRDGNTIIAQELLPLFKADPAAWQAVRHLHGWLRNDRATLAEFLTSWSQACPVDVRSVVRRIADVFGVALPGEATPRARARGFQRPR
jgi:hypothetical protein